jgi:hypothetical protein
VLLAGALCALASMSCGRGTIASPNSSAAADAGPAQASLPSQVLGLRVQPEDIASKLNAVKRPYVDAVAVYSLRDGDLLKASLQINRFNGAARPKDPNFIGSIVATIGGSASQPYRMSSQTVYATSTSDQVIFTWFQGRGMFVLAIQKSFPFPRTLLRRLVNSGLSV